jgi:hypothetical protein
VIFFGFLHQHFPVLALSLSSMGFRVAYTVRDDVGVTLEAALGVTVGLLVAGEVPDDQGLVATAREQHVGAIRKKHPSQKLFVHVLNQCPKSSKTNVSSSLSAYDFFCIFFDANSVFPYFSREVAREVTQPLWPSRVPRRTICSAMLTMKGPREEGGG